MAEPLEQVGLSVIAPAHNEADNVARLITEVGEALRDSAMSFEMILVDDGSTDHTRDVAIGLSRSHPWLRVLALRQTPPARGNGQSAAFHAGIKASRGALIALIDADLQNDPADLRQLLSVMQTTGADLVQGDRSLDRRDTFGRRIASLVGRLFRRLMLGDVIRDTGCSLRVMRREIGLALPLEFEGMHRFIPIMSRDFGFIVVEAPVSHRPRVAGRAKYGVFNRGLPAFIDCLAVRWMRRRRRPVVYDDLTNGNRDSAVNNDAMQSQRAAAESGSREAVIR